MKKDISRTVPYVAQDSKKNMGYLSGEKRLSQAYSVPYVAIRQENGDNVPHSTFSI
jgi:hypothetical protein